MEREPSCPGIEAELTAYFQGELSPGMRAEVEQHLAACDSCRAAHEAIRSVFFAAGEIEEIVPSLRFKRAVSGILAREREPQPDSVLFRLRSALAFLTFRYRVSPRFRLAAVSVAVHAVLLLIISFYVIPKWTEPVMPVVRIDPETGFTPAPAPDRPEVAKDDEGLDPEPPAAHPQPDERVVRRMPAALFPSTVPLQPPEHPGAYPRLSGLFTGGILTSTIKERRLAALGLDTDATLDTLRQALQWLAAEQAEDGSFPPSERNPGYRTGVSATVLLAFLADGHSQTRGTPAFRGVVGRGIRHLLDAQAKDGALRGLIGPAEGHYTYNHALATLALIEAWSVDRRRLAPERARELRIAIGLAVSFIVKAQTPDGGWRYQVPAPDAANGGAWDNDTSVSIFQVMALTAARRAGFETPVAVFDSFTTWLKRVTGTEGIVGYQRRGDRDHGPHTLTAGALFVEELLGLAAPLRDRQAHLVREELADLSGPMGTDGLLRFYSAHAFRLRGGNVLELIAPNLIEMQSADGSWTSGSDRHAVHAGDAFLTALNVLTLCSAYRFAG
jgi:hypothetical protein